jgi:acyl transferase domain-containing protein/acyl carrier protein/SAM-dependent methyltransferase/enoyl-[acyl-carrier-protein] reductase (NADH)
LADQTRAVSGEAWELNPAQPAGFLDWLSQLKLPVGCVIWQEQAPAPPAHSPASQPWAPEGIQGLFRLLKLLTASTPALDVRKITLVTEAAFGVRPGEAIHPPGAGSHGLVRVLAQEFPGLEFSSVDIPPAETDGQEVGGLAGPQFAQWVLAETGQEIALRNGQRYGLRLEPALDSPPIHPGLRRGGVYLIVGGAGGIGLELGLHLARQYQARLILTSRHELNPAQKTKLQLIQAAGGEVLHLRADVCRLEDMRSVRQEIQARFGALHGVFHSALVLKACRFRDLDESAFLEGLRPKAGGAAVLREIFGTQPLDFLAFFSSTQSLVGDAGQAAYATASRWLDALAGSIRQQVAYPVHVINWGYWDPKIVVSEGVKQEIAALAKAGDAGVEAHLKALGYGTLSVGEGLAALERILGQPDRFQRVVLRAEADLLKQMGADPEVQVAAVPEEAVFGIIDRLEGTEPGVELAGQITLFDQATQTLHEWGRRRVLKALQDMGGFTNPGDRRTRERWFAALNVKPAFKRLFEALLAMLVRENLLEETEQGIALRAAAGPDPETQSRLLAELQACQAKLRGFQPFLELVQVCCDRYPELLTGKTSPNEILFPAGNAARVQGIYQGNPIADYCNLALAKGFQSLLAVRPASSPATKPLRVLEVGAGTGGTTRELLPLLAAQGEGVHFTFTDLSSALVLAAKKELGPQLPGMEFRQLDLEQEVTRQGFRAGDYDIVIAANCLHATRDIRATLRRVKRLLSRGGFLLLNEAAATQDFLTITFGLLEGWWLFADPDLRLPHAPLLSRPTWETVLREEGFAFTPLLGSVGLGGAKTAQIVLGARSDGCVRTERRPDLGKADAVGRSARSRPAIAERGASAIQRRSPGTAMPARLSKTGAEPEGAVAGPMGDRDQKMGRLEGLILQGLAQVLQTTPAELEPGLPFTDYGVDSILAVEIIARLNGALGVSLRSTDLFNYPDVANLASHILDRHDAAVDWKKLFGESPAETKAQPVETPAPAGAADAEVGHSPRDQVLSEPAGIPPADYPPENGRPQDQSGAQTETPVAHRDIAVIGLAGQFPEAADIHQFWNNLLAGRDSVKDIPRERWEVDRFYDPEAERTGTTYCRTGGALAGIDLFDAAFFNISPVEAERMDPQQRLLLMEAWKALEDAGYSETALKGRACAFFLGCQQGDYNDLVERRSTPNAYSLLGNLNATLSARIAYYLNLKGPAVSIDTACSSSLVAIHLACDALRSGQCELALAGGVAVLTTPKFHVLASQAGMLSRIGKCRTFDAAADGFAPGEGVAVVVLKPLASALRDRDRIYGVIKGSGLNQDGKSNGLTAPNGPSQTALEAGVYRTCGIDPRSLQYIECHGTATRLGDPIEINALTDAFAQFTAAKQFCGIGSVKTNIGHALAAAGVAGFIKTLLCLQAAKLAPSLHFERPNEALRLEASPFYVVNRLIPWPVPAQGVRRAAVSAFGLSGTNCHLVLEEAPCAPDRPGWPPEAQGWFLIPLSAKTESSLAQKVADLRQWLDQHPEEPLPNLSYSLLCRRSHFSYRVCWLVRDFGELKSILSQGLQEGSRLGHAQVHLGENLKAPPSASLHAGNALISQVTGAAAEPISLDLEPARQLARHYIEGCELEWSRLFPAARLTAVSLPAYPFERVRFWMDEPQVQPEAHPVPAPSTRKKVLLRKTWRLAPLPPAEAAGVSEPCLILATPATLPLAESLGRCFPQARVLPLEEASANLPEAGAEIALDPFDAAKARSVIERILGEMPKIQGLLDLSELAAADPASAFRAPLGKLLLVQHLIRSAASEGLTLLHFTRELNSVQGSAPQALQGAVSAGLVKMLGAEYQRLHARTIDLDAPALAPESLASIVTAEWRALGDPGEVAYRAGMRYVPALEPMELAPDAQARASFQTRLDPQKFYVVTGGTRGLGFEIARHLVQGGVRKLVLMGRQALPPREQWAGLAAQATNLCESIGTRTLPDGRGSARGQHPPTEPRPSGSVTSSEPANTSTKIANGAVSAEIREKILRFRELESQGVELRVYSGSLTDEAALRQFLSPVKAAWGQLGGVVHCAGLALDEHPSFIQKTPDAMAQVLEPKVAALAVLDRIFSEEKIDFFILFSSIASLAPRLGVGLSDYAMANDFLNYYAAHRAHGQPGSVQSLMWPGWSEAGMGEVKSPVYLSLGLIAHTTAEGLALFEQALGQPACACLMPGMVNPEQFQPDALLRLRAERKTPAPAEIAGSSATPAGNPPPGVLQELRALFARELKLPVEKLGLDTHFERLGVDSILLAEFTKRIDRWLGVRLDPSCFLEHTTLRALADFLAQAYPAQLLKASGQGTVALPPPPNNSASAGNAGAPVVTPAPTFPRCEAEGGPVPSRAVAIIGMACHFPGAPDLGAFWANLAAGKSSIREVPPSRWDIGEFYRPDYQPGKSVSKWGGFIEGIEDFDPEFFRLPPKVAPHLDPAVRQFLEVSVQCLRDAGCQESAWDGRRVGVFVGARMSQYSSRIRHPIKESVIGIAQNFIGAHISHFFNFTGPNLLIDTACSSSLVSLHQACQSLLLGDSELALAGGVDILLDETIYLRLSEGQALSPDGRCHTFDETANGFVPGEGCGAVLLKPLAQALRDGDRIYAVIEASAVNNDGRTMGMTTPNPQAQQAVVREALKRARLTADHLTYVETHGTGTMIGDPIELKALNRVFRESTPATGFCGVGSVKTNVGHLLSAAGIASLIKVALALQRRQLPPTLNCEQPNRRFDFPRSPFYPVLRLEDWRPRHGLRCAGISSFGFGGTNAHVILRELAAGEAALIPAPRKALPAATFNRRRYWIDKPAPAGPSIAPQDQPPTSVPAGTGGNGNGSTNGAGGMGGARPPLLELELMDGTENRP